MDATSAQALPHGVASTRIPAWALPHTPADIRARLRPDLLIFQGLSSSDPLIPPESDFAARLSPSTLASLQAATVVHLVELGFTSHDLLTLCAKEKQHTLLVHHLQAAGWRLSPADVSHRPPLPQSLPSVITGITCKTGAPPTRLTIRYQRTIPARPSFFVPTGPNAAINIPHSPSSIPPPPTAAVPAAATPVAAAAARPGDLGWGVSPVWGTFAYGDPALLHLSRYVHIILLGTDGSLFLPLDSILTDVLRIPTPELLPLLHRLNAHSVTFTHAIIRRRRALDFDPSSIRIPLDFDPP